MSIRDWLKRNVDGRPVEDTGLIDNIEYNSMSGSQKNIEVGPALKYVSATNAATKICPGDQLFLFKTTAGLDYVTLGEDNSVVKGTAPAEDTFPVFGQEYTRISAADYNYIIGTADIHLYILRDEARARSNKTDR